MAVEYCLHFRIFHAHLQNGSMSNEGFHFEASIGQWSSSKRLRKQMSLNRWVWWLSTALRDIIYALRTTFRSVPDCPRRPSDYATEPDPRSSGAAASCCPWSSAGLLRRAAVIGRLQRCAGGSSFPTLVATGRFSKNARKNKEKYRTYYKRNMQWGSPNVRLPASGPLT